MSTQLDVLLYGIIYLAVSLVFGTLILFLVVKLFNVLTRDIDDIQELKRNNIAVAVLNAAIVFSVAMFVSEAVEAAMEAFKNNIFGFAGSTTFAGRLVIYGIMISHFILAAVISFIVLWIAIQLFIHLTRSLDEFSEIKKNNVAVGIFLAAFIVSMSLIMKPGVGRLLKGIVPFPRVASSPRAELVAPQRPEAVAHTGRIAARRRPL